jgi:hypothetical protein
MDKQQGEEVATIFFDGVQAIQSALEVNAGKEFIVNFHVGNCGKWTIEFIPKTEGKAANT